VPWIVDDASNHPWYQISYLSYRLITKKPAIKHGITRAISTVAPACPPTKLLCTEYTTLDCPRLPLSWLIWVPGILSHRPRIIRRLRNTGGAVSPFLRSFCCPASMPRLWSTVHAIIVQVVSDITPRPYPSSDSLAILQFCWETQESCKCSDHPLGQASRSHVVAGP